MSQTVFKLRRWNDVALVTIDNGEDWTKPTTFDRGALESLAACLDEIEAQEWRALVLTGKPFVFAAGADIRQFTGVTAEDARAGSRAGHELFARIAALPFPTVAAINGACLGGGVEIALHCDARTISPAVRHFAAPECFLGLFPAWGGTQLVPRLVGPQTAVSFIVENAMRQNRMLDGRTAFELGFADRLLDPVELVDESIAFALELAEAGGMHREPADLSGLPEACARARRQLDDAVHGAAPAPYAALDLIEGAGRWTLEEGYRAEEDAVAELLPGDEAQASVYAFELVELRQKRQPGIPTAEPRRIRKVGIVGAGLMATQLAQLFLRRLEVPLVIRDVDQARVDEALDTLRSTAKVPFHATLVSGTTGWDGFADCDLVLEAVFEELRVKQEVFAAAEQVVRPDCILATNTSSLSIGEIASGLEHPERVVGMHFFNPVAVMPLVELVRHDGVADETLATAAAVTRKLRKRGVLCGDAPGFVVNRVLTRMTGELMRALEHGNTVEETDEAILRLGMPMAPSVLLQMVGPRVANHVLETMHAAFPERFPLSQTLANYAEGREEIAAGEHAPVAVEAITDAVLEALADEIGHVLEEGVVAEAADVDTCLLLGAGFPFWLGGITKHLDQRGVSQRVLGRPLADVRAAATA
ncbi:MAG TPA: 3-hydroxyacyl-CoA dehydrogenase NAD-binding domain-containing protein [Gaiellaceae bacterium]|nr:3-hydroxyacyl-CoA dehydrogenase NAD-binding domain-containing protein [Gaiellaceae bacterium]